MAIKLVNIGFGNVVSASRIIAIVSPESSPIKRTIQDARDDNRLIDATYGRRTRAVLIMDSNHIILSAIQPETISGRLANDNTSQSSSSQASLAEEAAIEAEEAEGGVDG